MRGVVAMLPLALLVATEAAAAPRDPVAAEALFRSGREALRRGAWATACAKLGESQSLNPAAGTALNLAVCEEKQGHVASAWQRLREAIDLLPPGDDRIPLAQKRVLELESRVPHLTVRLAPDAPSGTRVWRDDVEVSGALFGFAQPIDPGPHVVRASAPGYQARSYRVASREGEPQDLLVEPGAKLPPPPARDSGRRLAAYLGFGIGGSAVALGAVTGLTVIARSNERQRLCPGGSCATQPAWDNAHSVDSFGKTLSLVSTTAFVVGGVALASGVYLLLSRSKEGAAPVALAPLVAPDSAALSVSGSF